MRLHLYGKGVSLEEIFFSSSRIEHSYLVVREGQSNLYRLASFSAWNFH
jgi:hypothetical protein